MDLVPIQLCNSERKKKYALIQFVSLFLSALANSSVRKMQYMVKYTSIILGLNIFLLVWVYL